MSSRAASLARPHAPTVPRSRSRSRSRKLHLRARRAVQCMLPGRALTPAEMMLVVIVVVMLAFWAAFVAAYHLKDQGNSWIDLLVVAVGLSLWACGQTFYVVVAAQESKILARRQEDLEMARIRGREEMRREMGGDVL